MRICMFGWEFPPFNSGGLGTACYGLTRGLAKKGVSLTLVLPKKLDLNVDFLKVVFADMDVHCVNSLLTPYMTKEEYECRIIAGDFQGMLYGNSLIDEVERYSARAASVVANEQFDIIHAHDWLTFKAGLEAKRVSGKPLVVHVHATEFDRTGGNGVNQYVYDIERRGMHEADMVIAVSNFTKNKIIEHYGVPAHKIKVVHNAIDIEESSLERCDRLKKENKVVLFLGRMTLQKGPDYFLYAATKVLEHYPNVVFLMVGSGDMERTVVRKAAELGIGHKVLFSGFLRGQDVNRAFQMADLYVMPSVSEPFGITPLESLMNGTPVLISKQSGVAEVLTHALKADFWDIDEMANKIVSFLRHTPMQECLTQNGVREVHKFNWEDTASKCVSIYNELAVVGRA